MLVTMFSLKSIGVYSSSRLYVEVSIITMAFDIGFLCGYTANFLLNMEHRRRKHVKFGGAVSFNAFVRMRA